jgi:hypothetical protein
MNAMAADSRSDLRAGRIALSECRWADARAAFERAYQAGAGSEALEGVAQAAFFLDDPNARPRPSLWGGSSVTSTSR